jgi:hypothetical protein
MEDFSPVFAVRRIGDRWWIEAPSRDPLRQEMDRWPAGSRPRGAPWERRRPSLRLSRLLSRVELCKTRNGSSVT